MTKERFELLLVKQLPKLLSHAQSYMLKTDYVEDLVQDTVLLMLEKFNTYRDDNFGAWAYTLLLNTKRNYSRRMKIVEYCDMLEIYDKGYYDYIEENIDIRNSINMVTSTMRHTAELFLQGYLYEEIAEQQAIGMGTVKSRINRARKQLQAVLQEYK